MLVDRRTNYPDLTGKVAEKALVSADITVNKIMVPFDRYFVTTFAPSLKFRKSGPVNGVTRFARITPLMMPSSSQKQLITSRTSTRLRNR